MGPVMDNLLNHYQFKFAYPSLVRGQGTLDNFVLDWRNTHSPNISSKGYIDFAFSGEIHKYGGAKDIYHQILSNEKDPNSKRLIDIDVKPEQSIASTNYCDIPNNPIEFLEDEVLSQIVISQTLATCWANEFAKSVIGNIILDTKAVNDFRGITDGSFDTSTLAEHLSLFKTKLGPKKQLLAKLGFKNINVLFG